MTTREKITASEFDAFLAENANRRFEFIFGEIVEKCRLNCTPISLKMLKGEFRVARSGDGFTHLRTGAAAKR